MSFGLTLDEFFQAVRELDVEWNRVNGGPRIACTMPDGKFVSNPWHDLDPVQAVFFQRNGSILDTLLSGIGLGLPYPEALDLLLICNGVFWRNPHLSSRLLSATVNKSRLAVEA